MLSDPSINVDSKADEIASARNIEIDSARSSDLQTSIAKALLNCLTLNMMHPFD